ncbi:hypothetical protein DOY81_008188, partial [Sarcophaga bullata]
FDDNPPLNLHSLLKSSLAFSTTFYDSTNSALELKYGGNTSGLISRKVQLAILTESFNAPYGVEYFPNYAEKVPEGPTCQALSKLPQSLGIYLIDGSIIERDASNKLYNTWHCMGGVKFNEALALTAGNEIAVVDIFNHKVGIGIYHDKRFEELARLYRCKMIVYPSAFCICQDSMHWELLQRARATDNQVFVAPCAPSRNNMSGYVAYGHSMIGSRTTCSCLQANAKRFKAFKNYGQVIEIICSVKMSQNVQKLTIAICQLPCGHNVNENVQNAIEAVKEAKAKNPKVQLAILPESFNAPYGVEYFPKYAEKVPEGPTCQALSKLAQSLGIYIIGGSIIERDAANKLYNTCTVWSPAGKLIGRHRKIHLFNIDIDVANDGGAKFNEGLALTAGNEITVVDIFNHKVGIGICHDKRFEELARLYRNAGCDMIVYPSAFCICQGPMHWELLQRARANDNQVFVVTCAPSRNNMSGYVAYGHSMIVDPWARVQREAGIGREIIIDEIDFSMVDDVRRQLPLYGQRRTDIYNTGLVKQ